MRILDKIVEIIEACALSAEASASVDAKQLDRIESRVHAVRSMLTAHTLQSSSFAIFRPTLK